MTEPRTAPDPLDPADMLGAVRGLPDQLAGAWRRYSELALPSGARSPERIVLSAMGGSAIGGDLAAGLLGAALRVPLVVTRGYHLPGWVDAATLVIAVSHSGDTEESLAAFAHAGARGAARVAITSGGRLASEALAAGAPLVRLPPGGQPRAALGSTLAAVLAVLRAAGALPDPGPDVAAAVASMRTAVTADTADGPAAALARHLVGRLPAVWALEDMAGVARRWKTQLNENTKVTATWDTIPELHHNAVVGLRDPAQISAHLHVVLLAPTDSAPRLARRVALTADLLAERRLQHSVLRAPAGPLLAQGLWLVQVGDLVSVHLARHYGVDPTPVDDLGQLKAAMAAAPD